MLSPDAKTASAGACVSTVQCCRRSFTSRPRLIMSFAREMRGRCRVVRARCRHSRRARHSYAARQPYAPGRCGNKAAIGATSRRYVCRHAKRPRLSSVRPRQARPTRTGGVVLVAFPPLDFVPCAFANFARDKSIYVPSPPHFHRCMPLVPRPPFASSSSPPPPAAAETPRRRYSKGTTGNASVIQHVARRYRGGAPRDSEIAAPHAVRECQIEFFTRPPPLARPIFRANAGWYTMNNTPPPICRQEQTPAEENTEQPQHMYVTVAIDDVFDSGGRCHARQHADDSGERHGAHQAGIVSISRSAFASATQEHRPPGMFMLLRYRLRNFYAKRHRRRTPALCFHTTLRRAATRQRRRQQAR